MFEGVGGGRHLDDGWRSPGRLSTTRSPLPPNRWTRSTPTPVRLAWAYDICNGNEIGGDPSRIHSRDVPAARCILVLGIDDRKAQEKFGFLLEAFKVRTAIAQIRVQRRTAS